jgi:hypothetical protein
MPAALTGTGSSTVATRVVVCDDDNLGGYGTDASKYALSPAASVRV